MARHKIVTTVPVEQACKDLRVFWEIGAKAAKEIDESGSEYGASTMKQEAERVGLNVTTFGEAVRIGREYTREQIDGMCEKMLQHDSRFGPTHLGRLLVVKDRNARDAIAEQAICERWGVLRLDHKIRADSGDKRSAGGRRPTIPGTESERLAVLGALTNKWLRWLDAAEPQLPEDLSEDVNRAAEAMASLWDALEKKRTS